MRAPLRRGDTLADLRARTAWRYIDGTFIPESERFEAYREEYERYVASGRARAATPERACDGTFLSRNPH